MHSGGEGSLELGDRGHTHQQNAISSWPHCEVFADRHRHDHADARASGAGRPHQVGSLGGSRGFHTNGADLAGKAAQPRYAAFLERAPAYIARQARRRSGPALAQTLDAYARARDMAGAAIGLSLDAQATVWEMAGLLAGLPRP